MLQISSFRVDSTVPLGHSLCGGWSKPAIEIVTPLYALGVVLTSQEPPVVLCSVDWTGICNDAHLYIRQKLAEAAQTTPERVAVHCVHQHNAPFIDLTAQKLVATQPGLASIMNLQWYEETVKRIADGVRGSLGRMERVTHIGRGQGKVEKVASNRRVVSPEGKLLYWRGSATRSAEARDQPEGTIDPMLKTVSFWNASRKLAALHYYAVHPMSYYGDGLIHFDFVGLAREKRTKEDQVPHIYFTGCAGNVAAGKYNDGDKANRQILADRVYAGMMASEAHIEREPAEKLAWRARPVILSPRADTDEAKLLETIQNARLQTAFRNRAAMKLSYRRRAEAKVPIQLSSLHLGDKVVLLHLPAESFIEYQLSAQEERKEAFVASAGYGDGGPWYIPLVKSFPEGGYEPSVAFTEPESEVTMRAEIKKLVQAAS